MFCIVYTWFSFLFVLFTVVIYLRVLLRFVALFTGLSFGCSFRLVFLVSAVVVLRLFVYVLVVGC